ncbi:MAG: glycosyltransferase family 2 protein [Candidatus Bathyarchaeota archaeon]|nr:MAG: glycosyltransferase family 2 protein [Candidatus Bathyarchaeota archaeon]
MRIVMKQDVTWVAQIILLFLASLVTLIQIIPLLLAIPVLFRSLNKDNSFHFEPRVTAIVPTHNEESVIERCINSLLTQDYPKEKLNILVVDDASTDRTREIIKQFEGRRLKLLTREGRYTKASAINYAKEHVNDDVVAIFDADACLEPSCIRIAVKNFADEKIGAVVGFQKPINIKQNWLTRILSIGDFLRFFMETVWSQYKANNFLMGECMFIRKKLLDEVGWFDDHIILEDSYVSMKIVFANYKIKLERRAVVWCEQPFDLLVYFKQRRRWFRGAFQLIGIIQKGDLSRFMDSTRRRMLFWGRAIHIFPYYLPLFITLSLIMFAIAYAFNYHIAINTISLLGVSASILILLGSSTLYSQWKSTYLYLLLWIVLGTLTMTTIVPLAYIDELMHKPVFFYKRPKKGVIMFGPNQYSKIIMGD